MSSRASFLHCPNDSIGGVTRNDLGIMQHIELFRSVSASVEQDGLFASRMIRKELYNVVS